MTSLNTTLLPSSTVTLRLPKSLKEIDDHAVQNIYWLENGRHKQVGYWNLFWRKVLCCLCCFCCIEVLSTADKCREASLRALENFARDHTNSDKITLQEPIFTELYRLKSSKGLFACATINTRRPKFSTVKYALVDCIRATLVTLSANEQLSKLANGQITLPSVRRRKPIPTATHSAAAPASVHDTELKTKAADDGT